jgi:hypothetical protein
MSSATLIVDDNEASVSGRTKNGDLLIDPEDVKRVTGWDLKDRGLCRDDTCLPVEDTESFYEGTQLKLSKLADRLNRPLAIHQDPSVAYLGPSRDQVSERLESGLAPDFTLPNWTNDQNVSLSDFEGEKIFLLVWASW